MGDIIPAAAQHEGGQLAIILVKHVQQAQMKSGAFTSLIIPFPLRLWTLFWTNTAWFRPSHNVRGYV